MRVHIISALFLLSAAVNADNSLSLPEGMKPFFVHKTIQDAWGNKDHNGVYCYEVSHEGVVGPFVDIYVVEEGRVVEKVSQGSNGKELMERIRKIEMKPFDYKKEARQTINRLTEEYQKQGKRFPLMITLDGHEYEIIYELDGVNLKINASNPGREIYQLAPHSENIGKLYAVYKELMLYYAERKFHFK